jgi:uncharacterized membrane protein
LPEDDTRGEVPCPKSLCDTLTPGGGVVDAVVTAVAAVGGDVAVGPGRGPRLTRDLDVWGVVGVLPLLSRRMYLHERKWRERATESARARERESERARERERASERERETERVY